VSLENQFTGDDRYLRKRPRPSDTWGFKSLGIPAPGTRERLGARQPLRERVSRSARRAR
jgi:hypothetical protein